MAISTYLAGVWSATQFDDPELSGYAAEQLRADTRIGVKSLAVLALSMQIIISALVLFFDLDSLYIYMSLLMAALGVHVLVSSEFINDIRTLHALAMTFLIAGALSITVLAHRSGDLNVGMMAAVIMLLVAIPLIPWALRETSIVVGLIFLLITSSLHSVPGRFDSGSLLILQVLIVGAATVVVVVTGKNTFIRKQDIRSRFELENAHEAMELLSMQDHLTGTWNRRYLDEKFPAIAEECAGRGDTLSIGVLDIDDFKGINDTFGHQVGDRILVKVADTFVRLLKGTGRVIRLGGDEFLIVYCGEGLDGIIDAAMTQLSGGTISGFLDGQQAVTLSAGIATTRPGEIADLNKLYKAADRALYSEKQKRPRGSRLPDLSTRTGTWQL